VLHADVVVLKPFGFVFGLEKNFAQAVCNDDAIGGGTGAGNARTSIEFCLHLGLDGIQGDIQFVEEAWDEPFRLFEKSEQKVFDVDLLVIESNGFVLRFGKRFL